jgi:hypothetical protein
MKRNRILCRKKDEVMRFSSFQTKLQETKATKMRQERKKKHFWREIKCKYIISYVLNKSPKGDNFITEKETFLLCVSVRFIMTHELKRRQIRQIRQNWTETLYERIDK